MLMTLTMMTMMILVVRWAPLSSLSQSSLSHHQMLNILVVAIVTIITLRMVTIMFIMFIMFIMIMITTWATVRWMAILLSSSLLLTTSTACSPCTLHHHHCQLQQHHPGQVVSVVRRLLASIPRAGPLGLSYHSSVITEYVASVLEGAVWVAPQCSKWQVYLHSFSSAIWPCCSCIKTILASTFYSLGMLISLSVLQGGNSDNFVQEFGAETCGSLFCCKWFTSQAPLLFGFSCETYRPGTESNRNLYILFSWLEVYWPVRSQLLFGLRLRASGLSLEMIILKRTTRSRFYDARGVHRGGGIVYSSS